MIDLNRWKTQMPFDPAMSERWDREWLKYFLGESVYPFIVSHERLTPVVDLRGKSAEAVFNTQFVADTISAIPSPTPISRRQQLWRKLLQKLGKSVPFTTYFTPSIWPALWIWVAGNDLVDKHVLEVGCGPGLLGKQLGKVVASYLGIDYSNLALYIARLTSPESCTYHHLADDEQIAQHYKSYDTMVGRNFFIHQNYENLLWVLYLGYALLKPGGIVSADFFMINPGVSQGVIRQAKDPLDEQYASCVFHYEREEIEAAAAETGFEVAEVIERQDVQRRFVLLRKP